MAILSKEEMEVEIKKLLEVVRKKKYPHCSLCAEFRRQVLDEGFDATLDILESFKLCNDWMTEIIDKYEEITIDLSDCDECGGTGFVNLKAKVIYSNVDCKNNNKIVPYIVCSRCKGWQKLDWVERITETKLRYRYSPDVIYAYNSNRKKFVPVLKYENVVS